MRAGAEHSLMCFSYCSLQHIFLSHFCDSSSCCCSSSSCCCCSCNTSDFCIFVGPWRRVRFNEVPEKVPKVPENVWEALVQSQVRFNRVPEKVLEKVPVKVWEALVQSQVRFNSA